MGLGTWRVGSLRRAGSKGPGEGAEGPALGGHAQGCPGAAGTALLSQGPATSHGHTQLWAACLPLPGPQAQDKLVREMGIPSPGPVAKRDRGARPHETELHPWGWESTGHPHPPPRNWPSETWGQRPPGGAQGRKASGTGIAPAQARRERAPWIHSAVPRTPGPLRPSPPLGTGTGSRCQGPAD